MKRHALKYLIYPFLPAILTAAGMTACVSEDMPECPDADKESYMLTVHLNTDGIFTRADWHEDGSDLWDSGSTFDNKLASVELFLLDEENRLTPLYAFDSPEGHAHTYFCEVDADTPGVTVDPVTLNASMTCKLMAVANIHGSSAPSWFEQESWESEKIPFDIGFGVNSGWYIPMWGVETYRNITLTHNHLTRIDDIYMLRGVAKVMIQLDSSVSSLYEITGVEMREESAPFNSQGYTLPGDAMSVSGTRYLQRNGCSALRDDSETMDDPIFVNEGNGIWSTYIAESRTTTSDPYSFRITIREKGKEGTGFSGVLYLAHYNKISPDDPGDYITEIVRNHQYQFTIKLAELTLLPRFKDWEWGGKAHIQLKQQ